MKSLKSSISKPTICYNNEFNCFLKEQIKYKIYETKKIFIKVSRSKGCSRNNVDDI